MADGGMPMAGRRVAIVHDWLTGMRGGEWCLDAFCELLPHATLFTLLHNRGMVSSRIESMKIETSFIQNLPGARRMHQRYLPFFPKAIERFCLDDYDFILSSSHCIAKGAVPAPGSRHVCYCHTPMRYIWEFYDDYFNHSRTGPITRLIMPHVAKRLRRWDTGTASRVNRFVANSRNVAGRIRSVYGREAEVIHAPVDLTRFRNDLPREDYFLILSALVPYKRLELPVRVFTELGLPLVIIGRGPEREHLESIAGGNVRFTGWASEEDVADSLARAKALVFPGVEDFGIVPLEAMASGCPVIAFRSGGVLETVIEENNEEGKPPTGIFFDRQDIDSIRAAIERFRPGMFDPALLRSHASRFDRTLFLGKIRALLEEEEALLP